VVVREWKSTATKIWDDAEDYYSNDAWLSPEERAVLKKLEAQRKKEKEEAKDTLALYWPG
jgi:hypothetical protein